MQFITQHPKQLWIMLFGSMWNTFSYYGTQTVLVLYVMHIFQFNRTDSYLIYGAYAAFVYATPLLGGVIGDKWIGCKNAIILGAIFAIIGNCLLISPQRYLFSLGLAIALVGSGFYASNMSNLVGTSYIDSAKKESGYTLYYLAVNVGGTLAPLIYGILIYFVNWNLVFLVNAILIALGLLVFLINLKLFSENESKRKILRSSEKLLIVTIILLVLIGASLIFYYFNFINIVISFLFLLSIAYIIAVIVFKYVGETRKHLLSLLSLSFFSTFYYIAALQVGTTIPLFIQEKINDGTINFKLPASTFSTLYCLFILLLAPFMAAIWNRLRKQNILLNPMVKLSIGIFLAAIGITIFAMTALTNFIISGILIGYLFLSAGELVMTPAIYTAISDLAPEGMKSTMMGSWTLFIALGGYGSSILARGSHFAAVKFQLLHSFYFTEFIIIAIFTFIIGLLLMCATPKLIKLMEQKKTLQL